MKKVIRIVLDIFLLSILLIFPFCISCIVEFLVSRNVKLSSSFLVMPMTLIGSSIAYYFFKEKYNIKLHFTCKKKLCILFLLFGFTLKSTIILLFTNVISSRTDEISLLEISIAVLITPVAEELFRIILLNVITVNNNSKLIMIIAAVISSFIWTMIHFYGLSLPSVLLFVDGLILALIYIKFDSIIYNILYHSALNLSMYLIAINLELNKWIYLIIDSVLLMTTVAFFVKYLMDERKNEILLHKTTRHN